MCERNTIGCVREIQLDVRDKYSWMCKINTVGFKKKKYSWMCRRNTVGCAREIQLDVRNKTVSNTRSQIRSAPRWSTACLLPSHHHHRSPNTSWVKRVAKYHFSGIKAKSLKMFLSQNITVKLSYCNKIISLPPSFISKTTYQPRRWWFIIIIIVYVVHSSVMLVG